MFNYRKETEGYYIGSDNIKGDFGPFGGVYVKNKIMGDFDEKLIDTNKYPGYKYSIGIGENKIFVIGLKGVEGVLEK